MTASQSQMLQLRILIEGDDPADAYELTISNDKTVANLKKLFFDQAKDRFDYYDASSKLVFRSVNCPVDSLQNIGSRHTMASYAPLSVYYQRSDNNQQPDNNLIHIVVQKPKVLWVLLEDEEAPTCHGTIMPMTLENLSTILCLRMERLLRNRVRSTQLKFFVNDDKSKVLSRATSLSLLRIAEDFPLIVRFPISDLNIEFSIYFLMKKKDFQLPYTTGIWDDLLSRTIKCFSKLRENNVEFEFVTEHSLTISDAYSFGILLKKTIENNEAVIHLTVQLVQDDETPEPIYTVQDNAEMKTIRYIYQQMIPTLRKLELPDTNKFVDNHRLLKRNVIPIGPNEQPDMRFYTKKIRGQSAQSTFDQLKRLMYNPKDPTPYITALVGVSGCGKTATIFELGRNHFVTFFVIPRRPIDLVEYGADVTTMMYNIEALVSEKIIVREWTIDAIRKLKAFEKKVIHLISSLLVARRVSWTILRKHFGEQLTPLVWLYCQELPQFGRLFGKIYKYIAENFNGGDLKELSRELSDIFEEITSNNQRFVIAIDECHRLTRYSRDVFLPRGIEILDPYENITEEGQVFIDYHTKNQIMHGTSIKESQPHINSSLLFRSLFPVVVEGFIISGAQTLVMLGTNLELNNLTELSSMVGKYSEEVGLLTLTEFHTFTLDDVIAILRECLNNQGLTLTNVKEIANQMQGRARFTIGFLELVARSVISDGKLKIDALRLIKREHENTIVKSGRETGLQRLLGSLVNNSKSKHTNTVTTPTRGGNFAISGKIINVIKLLQDMLIMSMFSRDKMLFSSLAAVHFVQYGLVHLTMSESPWSEDVCENDLYEHYLDEELGESECSTDDSISSPSVPAIDDNDHNNDQMSDSTSSIDSQAKAAAVDVYESRGVWCTLAEPWVRLALIEFFQNHYQGSIFSNHLANLITSPTLSYAACGTILEWSIMSNINHNWAGRPLFNILVNSGLLKESHLPLWLKDLSLQVKPFDKIHDESSVSADDDSVIKFLQGNIQNIALLPSTFAGPDGICATSTKGVFLVFASALSIKNKVKHQKYVKNVNTTDLARFYTKSNGDLYAVPKSKASERYSLRSRYENVQKLKNQNYFDGILRIHFHIPEVAGVVSLSEIVEVGNRTDMILNLNLKTATKLGLIDDSMTAILSELCLGNE